MKLRSILCLLLAATFNIFIVKAQNNMVVLETDFGVKDGAVASMKGVITQVDNNIRIYDITHEVPAFNIWEAAFRLQQTINYWPKGTVFVVVVDPGVGSKRKAIVAQTNSGHFIVTPDNGTLTLVAEKIGIKAVREIDEKTNRLPGSENSYTFHGRDIFAYTAARLASNKITFEQVGRALPQQISAISYQKAIAESNTIKGSIPVLDVQYGNVWTNIDEPLLRQAGIKNYDPVMVQIFDKDRLVFSSSMLFVNTFSDVPEQELLCYLNSEMNFSIAINMGNFAERFKIGSGPSWKIVIKK
jgi:S-adenosylmethionine hydrolase